MFDYGPQHQSTCGLNFNEPVNGGPIFGPALWAGDALVTGYSRGKLFRTKLVKTPAGYVAQNQLLAVPEHARGRRLCLAARRTGRRGPQRPARLGQRAEGEGQALQDRIQRARCAPAGARLGLGAAGGPHRLRPAARSGRTARPRQQDRDRVRPGRPPGRPLRVAAPRLRGRGTTDAQPRFELPILSAQVSADRRSLLLATAPHPEASSYAITLPRPGRAGPARLRAGELPQVPTVDLGYDLSGVDAAWRPENGRRRLVRLAAAPRPGRRPCVHRIERGSRPALAGDGTPGPAGAPDQARSLADAAPGRPARLDAGYTLPDEEVVAGLRRLRADRGDHAGRKHSLQSRRRRPVPRPVHDETSGARAVAG